METPHAHFAACIARFVSLGSQCNGLWSLQVGFCDAVEEPTAEAMHREELLELVFKAYAQLWDEVIGVRVILCSIVLELNNAGAQGICATVVLSARGACDSVLHDAEA